MTLQRSQPMKSFSPTATIPGARAWSQPAAAQHSSLQSFCAQMALFLLPMPAIKMTVTTMTLADLFLIPAIVMNLGYVLKRVHGFQIPLLMAFPLFLLSHLLDADGELITVFQVCYLWGFLIPFGWCAFVNIPLRRIALLILAANVVSALFGLGQFIGFIPELPTQNVIHFRSSLMRAAGLTLKCNALAMSLTPCFLLLPYLPRVWPRIVVFLTLLLGFVSTVSKSIVLALPGVLFYFLWREPQKGKFVLASGAMTLAALFFLAQSNSNPYLLWEIANEAAQHRLEGVDDSIEDRTELVKIAMDLSQECLLLGFGTEGTVLRISQSTGVTVHVFYLGLVVTAGYPVAVLVVVGFLLIVAGLWKQREYNVSIFLVAHLLALSVMTLLYLSFQYLPFMVAASVLASNEMKAKNAVPVRPSLAKGRRLAA